MYYISDLHYSLYVSLYVKWIKPSRTVSLVALSSLFHPITTVSFLTCTASALPFSASLPGMWERTITIGSAGKTFSATGWKLGWAMGPKHLIHALQVVHQNCIYTCPTPLQVVFKWIQFISGLCIMVNFSTGACIPMDDPARLACLNCWECVIHTSAFCYNYVLWH